MVAAILVALVLVTLSSSLIGGKVFGSGDNLLSWPPFTAEHPAGWIHPSNRMLTDPVLGFNPDLLLSRADLGAGTAPLWNPYVGAGRPLLASHLPALLFPSTWLALLLPFWSSLAWVAAAKLLLTAAGLYLLCRDLGLRRGPSLLGAIGFPFSVYYFVWLEHTLTNVWAALPWMLLGARRVCTRGSLGGAALLGLATGFSWFGGHPESSAFALLATVLFGAFELLAERFWGPATVPREPDRRTDPGRTSGLGRRAGLFVGSLGLGLGLTAIVNVPFAELLGQASKTQRGGPAAPWRFMWPFFFPELWGSPNKAYVLKTYNFNERTGYFGGLPMLLALGAIGRRRPREQWFFLGLALLAIATIFDTPLWAAGLRDLPGGKLTALSRMLILVCLSGSVLAAYGLQRWLEGSARDRRQMLTIMALVAVIPPLVWLLGHTGELSHLGSALGQLPTVSSSERSPQVFAMASVWRWILICGLGIGALALLRRRRAGMVVIALAVVLTALDLIPIDRAYHGAIPQSEANPAVPASIRYLQAHQGDGRITASRVTLPANLSERYGLRDPRAAVDLPFPSRYLLLWTRLGGGGGDEGSFNAQNRQAQRLADLFATRYVLLAPGEPVPGWLHPVLSTSGGTVAYNPTALPRAWVAYGWRQAFAEANSLVETQLSSTAQLHSQPVIEGSPAPPSGAPPPPTPALVSSDGQQRVTVQANVVHPGYLVLDDSAYPGWQVTVDGRSSSWKPANTNFRAVALAPGHHVVTFLYRPASVIAGAILSVICGLVLLGLAGFSVRSRARTEAR